MPPPTKKGKGSSWENALFGGNAEQYALPRNPTSEEAATIKQYIDMIPEMGPIINNNLQTAGTASTMDLLTRLGPPEGIMKTLQKLEAGEVSEQRVFQDVSEGIDVGGASGQTLKGMWRSDVKKVAPHKLRTLPSQTRDIFTAVRDRPVEFFWELGKDLVSSTWEIPMSGWETMNKIRSGSYKDDPEFSWRPLTGGGEKGTGLGLAGALQMVPMTSAWARGLKGLRGLKTGYKGTSRLAKTLDRTKKMARGAAHISPEAFIGYKLSNRIAKIPPSVLDAASLGGNALEIEVIEWIGDIPFQLALNHSSRLMMPIFQRIAELKAERERNAEREREGQLALPPAGTAYPPTTGGATPHTPETGLDNIVYEDEELLGLPRATDETPGQNRQAIISGMVNELYLMADDTSGRYTPYRDTLLRIIDEISGEYTDNLTVRQLNQARDFVTATKDVINELTTDFREIIEDKEKHLQVQELRRERGWTPEQTKARLREMTTRVQLGPQHSTSVEQTRLLNDALQILVKLGQNPTLENLTEAERIAEFVLDPANKGYADVRKRLHTLADHIEEHAGSMIADSAEKPTGNMQLDEVLGDSRQEGWMLERTFPQSNFRYQTLLDTLTDQFYGRATTREEKDAFHRGFAANLISIAEKIRTSEPTLSNLISAEGIYFGMLDQVFNVPQTGMPEAGSPKPITKEDIFPKGEGDAAPDDAEADRSGEAEGQGSAEEDIKEDETDVEEGKDIIPAGGVGPNVPEDGEAVEEGGGDSGDDAETTEEVSGDATEEDATKGDVTTTPTVEPDGGGRTEGGGVVEGERVPVEPETVEKSEEEQEAEMAEGMAGLEDLFDKLSQEVVPLSRFRSDVESPEDTALGFEISSKLAAFMLGKRINSATAFANAFIKAFLKGDPANTGVALRRSNLAGSVWAAYHYQASRLTPPLEGLLDPNDFEALYTERLDNIVIELTAAEETDEETDEDTTDTTTGEGPSPGTTPDATPVTTPAPAGEPTAQPPGETETETETETATEAGEETGPTETGGELEVSDEVEEEVDTGVAEFEEGQAGTNISAEQQEELLGGADFTTYIPQEPTDKNTGLIAFVEKNEDGTIKTDPDGNPVSRLKPHPANLKESAGLAITPAPTITYIPDLDILVNIPVLDEDTGLPLTDKKGKPVTEEKSIIDDGLLSAFQIEPIAKAGQIWAERTAKGFRKAIMWGHGTGSGKGRMISGVIIDYFNKVERGLGRVGRTKQPKRALWVTSGDTLATEDAMRDWRDMGQDPDKIFNFRKPDWDKRISSNKVPNEGVMTITYSMLSSADPKLKDTLNNESLSIEERDRQLAEIISDPKNKTLYYNLFSVLNWLKYGNKQKEVNHKSMQDSYKHWKSFQGVIAFDEAHSMKGIDNLLSQTAISLQNLTPESRVAYATATAATEVDNFRYASRLGLWGDGTEFVDSTDFIAKLSRTKLAGLEMLTKDLKGLGLYVAAQLSFDDCEFEPLTAPLDQGEKVNHNDYVGFLNEVRLKFEGLYNDNQYTKTRQNANALLRRHNATFWAKYLRDAGSFQASLVGKLVVDHYKENHADKTPVFQIVQTGEEMFNRNWERVLDLYGELDENNNKALEEEEIGSTGKMGIKLTPEMLETFDPTGKTDLIYWIDKEFDCRPYKKVGRNYLSARQIDKDNEKIREENKAKGGKKKEIKNTAPIPELITAKAALLKPLGATVDPATGKVNDIQKDVGIRFQPPPLHTLIEEFGTENLAEMTGRDFRLEKHGDTWYWAKHGKVGKKNDLKAFKDDKKRALVFSGAGATGASYHASNEFINNHRRVHYVIQPGYEADQTFQGFGRTNRTNQKSAPIYVPVDLDLPSAKRFSSIITSRLKALGALSVGSQTGSASEMYQDASDIILTKEAQQSLRDWLQDTWGPQNAFAAANNDASIRQYLNKLARSPDLVLILPTKHGGRSTLETVIAQLSVTFEQSALKTLMEIGTGTFQGTFPTIVLEGEEIEGQPGVRESVTKTIDLQLVHKVVQEQFLLTTQAFSDMGLEWDPVTADDENQIPASMRSTDVIRWLNRMMALPYDWQARMFDMLTGRIETAWDEAVESDEADVGIKNLNAKSVIPDSEEPNEPVFTGTAGEAFINKMNVELYSTETTLSGVVQMIKDNVVLRRQFDGIRVIDKGSPSETPVATFRKEIRPENFDTGDDALVQIKYVYPSAETQNKFIIKEEGQDVYESFAPELISAKLFLEEFIDGNLDPETINQTRSDGSPFNAAWIKAISGWQSATERERKTYVNDDLGSGNTDKVATYWETRYYITGTHLPIWNKLMPTDETELPVVHRIPVLTNLPDGSQRMEKRVGILLSAKKGYTDVYGGWAKISHLLEGSTSKNIKPVIVKSGTKATYPEDENLVNTASDLYTQLTRWFDGDRQNKKVVMFRDGSIIADFPYTEKDIETGQDATFHRLYLFTKFENPEIVEDLDPKDPLFIHSQLIAPDTSIYTDAGFITHPTEGNLVLPSNRVDAVRALADTITLMRDWYPNIPEGEEAFSVHDADIMKQSRLKPVYIDTMPDMSMAPTDPETSNNLFTRIPEVLVSIAEEFDFTTREKKKVGGISEDRELTLEDLFTNDFDGKSWVKSRQPNIVELLYFEDMARQRLDPETAQPDERTVYEDEAGRTRYPEFGDQGIKEQWVSIHFLGGKAQTFKRGDSEYGYLVTVQNIEELEYETLSGAKAKPDLLSVLIPVTVLKGGKPVFSSTGKIVIDKLHSSLGLKQESRAARRIMQVLNIAMLEEQRRNFEFRLGPYDPSRNVQVGNHGDSEYSATIYATSSIPKEYVNMATKFAATLGFHYGTDPQLAKTKKKTTNPIASHVIWDKKSGQAKAVAEERRPQTATKILLYSDIDTGELTHDENGNLLATGTSTLSIKASEVKDQDNAPYRNS